MQQYVHNGAKTAMSKDILQSYILGHNFTKNSVGNNVRPPAIGEETDLQSVGGRSSHSSISEKSEVSTATPRRFDVDLGYEPEGSASPLPPHEKWKQSMYSMLHDSEGFLAFKSFLSGTNEAIILECWLAMKGFRDFDRPRSSGNSSAASSTTGSLSNTQTSEERSTQKVKLAKLIYKTYLASNSPKCISSIKAPTKQYIMRLIKAAVENKTSAELDSHIFVQAQTEIEYNVEATLYKSFLASEEFAKLTTQQDGSSSKMSSNITPQSTASQSPKNSELVANNDPPEQPITGSQIPYLPRLDEDQVWSPSERKRQGLNPSEAAAAISRNSDSLSISIPSRSNVGSYGTPGMSRVNEGSDAFPYFTEGAPSYWVPPASAIGSDQASKSSDATSDTLSFTDNSSVDGVAYSASRQGQKRLMRNHIKKNPTNALPECPHVQRTSRMKDIPNLATKDPAAFFELLRIRLVQVLEEQKMKLKRVGVQFRARPLPPDPIVSIKNEEEDMDQLLESHLQRVMHSPGGRHSPVMKGRQPRPPPPKAFYPPPVQQDPVGIGVVPGMAQNEVPDVATPVIPVNKTQMISAWIQTPLTQSSKIKKKSRANPLEPEASPSGHYLHPAESTGLQSGANTSKMQLLLQDRNMPLFDQPDAMTTIEEVKRRLMEETDGSYEMSLESLKISSIPPSASTPAAPSTSFTPRNPQSTSHSVSVPQEPSTDSDSSTETATLSNVNHSVGDSPSPIVTGTTTVVYQMLNDAVPYKVKVPHKPLTLGQFKHAMPRKGNFRYYFRQYSPELKKPIFYELSKDSEILPLYEGCVLAKIDSCSA